MEAFAFYFCAAAAIAGAAGVVFFSQPVRALLALLATMAVLSVLYVLLQAPFVALVNLIVYAGAVLVLFLFVIMLLGLGAREIPLRDRFRPFFIPAAVLTAVAVAGLLVQLTRPASSALFQALEGEAREIGLRLFTVYLLPFELISLLLLLAIFAAVTLAKNEDAV